ncbi:hypothetical protein [Solemya velum gill symbiont]|uniref:hypothetical protein n=1 Tax=Solemya velum gill symbiont TaxID=2340 RepID=UPI0015C3CCE1|nr:hypothetical protein [Solemya velum gill symbiont]
MPQRHADCGIYPGTQHGTGSLPVPGLRAKADGNKTPDDYQSIDASVTDDHR